MLVAETPDLPAARGQMLQSSLRVISRSPPAEGLCSRLYLLEEIGRASCRERVYVLV